MAKQKEDDLTLDLFIDNEDIQNFIKNKIDQNELFEAIKTYSDKDNFAGDYASESRFIIADFKGTSVDKIKTVDLDVLKSMSLTIQDLKIIFSTQTILLQKMNKDDFEFSINDNIDIIEKIEKQKNKDILSKAKDINPDKLLNSIKEIQGIDVENDIIITKRKKRSI
jgi:hypothetical protein